MFELFQLVSLSGGSNILATWVIFEGFVFFLCFNIVHFFYFVDIFADEFGIAEGLYFFLQKFYLFIFLINCFFQGFDVGCCFWEESSLFHSSELNFFIGELFSAIHRWHIGHHTLILLEKRLSSFWQLQLDSFVWVVANHGIFEAAIALQGIFDFGFVLGAGDIAAKIDVHLFQLNDILQLWYFLVFGADQT